MEPAFQIFFILLMFIFICLFAASISILNKATKKKEEEKNLFLMLFNTLNYLILSFYKDYFIVKFLVYTPLHLEINFLLLEIFSSNQWSKRIRMMKSKPNSRPGKFSLPSSRQKMKQKWSRPRLTDKSQFYASSRGLIPAPKLTPAIPPIKETSSRGTWI